MRIFWKQLLLHLGTLVISFVLLALVLTQGIRGFLTEQKVAEMTTLAQRVAISMENSSQYGMMNLRVLYTEVQNIHRYTDAVVVIMDRYFAIELEYGFDGLLAELYIPELAPVMEGEIVAIFGVTNQPGNPPLLIVGYPFWFGDEVGGAALVGHSMADLENAIDAMYRITRIALVAIGVFAFVLIYISSKAISHPLRQMSDAAGIIAGGDLEKRLPIRSKDEIGQLAGQFNKMAESLQEQDRIRRAFIANLSHDMRSPLTSIRGFLTAIHDGTIPQEKQPHYLNIIQDETERLIKLSNNILDIHLIQDSGITLQKSQFDINELLRYTILGFQQRAIDKQIMITSHFANLSDVVFADEDKMRRVIYNLIDNALKFTPAGGEITVETTIVANDNKITISVADNGRGMTEEEQKHAFDRFYKGDPSRNKDKFGSGLGLSIVKEFVRAHGSIIAVESEVGKGTKFILSLELLQ